MNDTAPSDRTTGNQRLLAESAEIVPGGVHTSIRIIDPPLCVQRARGGLHRGHGRQAIHRLSRRIRAVHPGALLSRCHRECCNAIRETDLYGISVTPMEVELAKKIVTHVPSVEQVLFCCTGSEATFHAVRLARAATSRSKVIKFQGCYHGWHDYVLRNVISSSNLVGGRDPGSAGMLTEAIDNTLVCRFNDLASVEDASGTTKARSPHHPRADPAQCGCDPASTGLSRRPEKPLRSRRHRPDLRRGDHWFPTPHWWLSGDLGQVTPDLTTMGKAIANGFPMAAIAGKRDLMQQFNTRTGGDVYFAGTFNGHSSCVAAALATIEVLETGKVHPHIFRLGERMRAGASGDMQTRGYPRHRPASARSISSTSWSRSPDHQLPRPTRQRRGTLCPLPSRADEAWRVRTANEPETESSELQPHGSRRRRDARYCGAGTGGDLRSKIPQSDLRN